MAHSGDTHLFWGPPLMTAGPPARAHWESWVCPGPTPHTRSHGALDARVGGPPTTPVFLAVLPSGPDLGLPSTHRVSRTLTGNERRSPCARGTAAPPPSASPAPRDPHALPTGGSHQPPVAPCAQGTSAGCLSRGPDPRAKPSTRTLRSCLSVTGRSPYSSH